MADLTNEEETTRQTYDKFAKDWTSGHLSPGYWKEEMRKLKQLLPTGKVLEVGCGGGRDARELKELGYSYLGTDISSGLLQQARQNSPGIDFKQMSVYELDFEEQFDGFWCAAVLLHIPKKRINEALQSIKNSIRRGGVGFIAIKEGIGEQMEAVNSYDGEGRFFAYWQKEEFKKVLMLNGFQVLADGYRPMNERTKWLTYHVRVR